MEIEVAEEPIGAVAGLARVSIAFEVDRVLDAEARGDGGFALAERRIDAPYRKDYDVLDGGPATLAGRFDVGRWGFVAARLGGELVGGAVVAFDTPGVEMLEGRRDLAVLWDIRVAPRVRGRGVGAVLFRVAEAWARGRGCRELKIETQNVNAAACRFYAAMGCELRRIDRHAYPGLPGEIQMLWYRDLSRA